MNKELRCKDVNGNIVFLHEDEFDRFRQMFTRDIAYIYGFSMEKVLKILSIIQKEAAKHNTKDVTATFTLADSNDHGREQEGVYIIETD